MRLTPEPAGLNCVDDGLRVDMGLDNGDGWGIPNDDVLHDDEIDQTSYVCTRVVCGDSLVSAGETCDDGNQTTETCAYGDTGGCTVCNAACQLAPGEITFCGDGSTDTSNGEACDDGNTSTEACDYGLESCSVCDSSCQSVPGATSFCGDGNVDGDNGETCDDGNTTTEVCDYNLTSCAVCDSNCQGVPGATSFCGDGVVDGDNGETCDDGNSVTDTCTYGTTEGCTVCTASCVEGPGTITLCGDGTVDAVNGETCDDGNLTPGDGCDESCHAEVVSCADTTSFSHATQLYCNGFCSWAGESGCDQADADILCKLTTGSATSTATSFTIAPGDLSRSGFPCPGFGTNSGPMPQFGVEVDVHCADGTLPPNHSGDVVTNVTCTP